MEAKCLEGRFESFNLFNLFNLLIFKWSPEMSLEARTDGRPDRRMDGWTEGRTEGWMDGSRISGDHLKIKRIKKIKKMK